MLAIYSWRRKRWSLGFLRPLVLFLDFFKKKFHRINQTPYSCVCGKCHEKILTFALSTRVWIKLSGRWVPSISTRSCEQLHTAPKLNIPAPTFPASWGRVSALIDLRFAEETGNELQVCPSTIKSLTRRLMELRELREGAGVKPQLKSKVGRRKRKNTVGQVRTKLAWNASGGSKITPSAVNLQSKCSDYAYFLVSDENIEN